MRRFLKSLAVIAGAIVILLALLVSPALYVETFCHGEPQDQTFSPLIVDPQQQREEANTYLTYPEWHIVYAYDGLAETLKYGDEYLFDYWGSIADFWRADCALTAIADAHGGADTNTRLTIATIGVSFTLEMGMKAAYEETLGRLAAWWRGPQKSPQDIVARDMAIEYAEFLRQVPWYKFPFQKSVEELWSAPIQGTVRGWERRLALGLEWQAKIAYAKAIAGAVDAAGHAKLTIYSVISGLGTDALSKISDVRIVANQSSSILIETPRYDRFTHILADIAKAGGDIEDIAGNDDIMLTVTVPPGEYPEILRQGDVIFRLQRTGFENERVLISVKVRNLGDILRRWPIADSGVEHIFDY